MEHPLHFYFSADDMGGIVTAASFEHPSRSLLINPEYFHSDNLLDMLIAFHEVIHSIQDAIFRMNLDKAGKFHVHGEFFAATGDTPKSLVDFEAPAFALEIELLDILLDGELKRRIQAGEYDVDFLESVRRRLKGRPGDGQPGDRDLQTVGMLCNMATYLYPTGYNGGRIPEEFRQYVGWRNRLQYGATIYELGEDGLPRPYRVPEVMPLQKSRLSPQ
jgi:hypothetical protein